MNTPLLNASDRRTYTSKHQAGETERRPTHWQAQSWWVRSPTDTSTTKRRRWWADMMKDCSRPQVPRTKTWSDLGPSQKKKNYAAARDLEFLLQEQQWDNQRTPTHVSMDVWLGRVTGRREALSAWDRDREKYMQREGGVWLRQEMNFDSGRK
jgi:hypothetical protein